jgi:glycosyltransferase involved in cell wall biosynthesis
MARNRGISLARGEFIQFVDADDFLNQDAVEMLVNTISGSDLAVAGYRNLRRFSEEEISPPQTGTFCISEFVRVIGQFIETDTLHYIWHKLYRASLLKNRVSFRSDIRIGEDMIFNLEYLKNVDTINIIDKPVYNHIRYNEESITSRYKPNLFMIRKEIHNAICTFLILHDQYKSENKRVVDRLYARRIDGCFRNLFSPGSTISRDQALLEIKCISDDESVRGILDSAFDYGLFSSMIGFFLKRRKASAIYCTYKIRSDLGRFKRRVLDLWVSCNSRFVC